MSKITPDTVKKIAKLANLPISTDEERIYTEQLSNILDYVEQLGKVDVSKTEPTYNVTNLKSILREDTPRPSLSQEDSLKNAPNKKMGLILTKGVFGDE